MVLNTTSKDNDLFDWAFASFADRPLVDTKTVLTTVDPVSYTHLSAYEKRGTAVNVPEWDAAKCVGCNQCAFVCSHATIRPFLLTADDNLPNFSVCCG